VIGDAQHRSDASAGNQSSRSDPNGLSAWVKVSNPLMFWAENVELLL
jgi:hypothetical protein